MDGSGNLFIADTNNQRIREVSANGTIITVAGNPPACTFFAIPGCCGGYSGDGGQATAAQLNNPGAVAVDGAGKYLSLTPATI